MNSKEDFLKRCMRSLGDGVIRVDLSDEQIEDCYTKSVLHFYDRHFKSKKDSFMVIKLTEEDVKNGYIQMPENVDKVVELLRNSGFGKGLMSQGSSFPIVNGQIGHMTNGAFSGFGILGETGSTFPTTANFGLLDQYLGTSAKLLSIEKRFTYKHLSRKLQPEFKAVKDDTFVVHFYEKLDEDDYFYIHNDIWMYEFCSALLHKQWAINITKYENDMTSNGVKINGAQKLIDAELEIARLIKKLDEEYVFNGGIVRIG